MTLGVFGEPRSMLASGVLTPEGVDLQNSLTLSYQGGAHAQLITSIGAECPSVVTVGGTEGWLRSSAPLFNPAELIIQPRSGTPQTERFEVTRCLQAGLAESPFMTPESSVGTRELLDEARLQMRLRCPSDPQPPTAADPLAGTPAPRTVLRA